MRGFRGGRRSMSEGMGGREEVGGWEREYV